MELFVLVVFILGYVAITLEHPLRLDKLIPALLMMAFAWAGVALGIDHFTQWFDSANYSMLEGFASYTHEAKLHVLEETLLHHFGKTCEILIFLMGAMTIVEIIDHFNGFSTIKSFVKTNKKKTLLWIICFLAFILSAIIDNLTATIVLITILRKLLTDKNDRLWFAGLIIVAANAGGAWSPIGDVTTTMLWIGNKVSAMNLVTHLLLPSFVCMVIPAFIASLLPAFKGTFERVPSDDDSKDNGSSILYLGLIMIVFVPVFKTVTHLPPYIGMMLSLGVVSLVAELKSQGRLSLTRMEGDGLEHSHSSPTMKALSKIEMPSILFFLGILMTVAALESLGMIFTFGQDVRAMIPDELFVMLMGVGSAVIDNVPLVAASMGMFDIPMDNATWHFIAFSAGTGGSMLVIGSAAGVVAMGMENISFGWYFKNISWLALIGFLAGSLVFLAFN
ncbi:MAG: Na+/H+ antiporter NhaD/arsenite permease-like protein [Flavobacteriales bacterium]|jgi:Na+/H+ antiporter NhaD/arsenite permease-like protein